MDQAKAFGALIASARAWVTARAKLRQALDSKRAKPQDIEKAREAVGKTANSLEKAVRAFDQSVKMPYKGRSRISLGDLAGAVAKIAGGVEQAVKVKKSAFSRVEVIDTDGETL